MPSTLRQKRRSKERGNKVNAIAASTFALLFALGFLARSSYVDNVQLFFALDSIPTRSLSTENSNLLHLRASTPAADGKSHLSIPGYGKYEPVNCKALLQRALGNGGMDPNKGVLHGKQIEIEPKFWISLHNKETDITRWHIMEFGHYYERALSQAFIDVLKDAPPGSRVVDVGGNIGFFTLLSAAHGPVIVDTFEPNNKNDLRLCESLALNHWHSEFNKDCARDPKQVSMVNLYPLGVGRKEAVLSFTEHPNNPGQGVFAEEPPRPHGTGLSVVTLDNFARERGWFVTKPDIAILKVDIEGMEFTAIEGALELLKAKIVRNIFMEVSARTPQEREINKPALRLLQQSGYKLHMHGGFRGPNKEVDFPQDENIAERIMQLTDAEAAKQLNLWWKLAG